MRGARGLRDEFSTFHASAYPELAAQTLAITGDARITRAAAAATLARVWRSWPSLRGTADVLVRARWTAVLVAAERESTAPARSQQAGDAVQEITGAAVAADLVVVTALQRLPRVQRRALVLHYMGGVSVRHLSELSGSSAEHIELLLDDGFTALADSLVWSAADDEHDDLDGPDMSFDWVSEVLADTAARLPAQIPAPPPTVLLRNAAVVRWSVRAIPVAGVAACAAVMAAVAQPEPAEVRLPAVYAQHGGDPAGSVPAFGSRSEAAPEPAVDGGPSPAPTVRLRSIALTSLLDTPARGDVQAPRPTSASPATSPRTSTAGSAGGAATGSIEAGSGGTGGEYGRGAAEGAAHSGADGADSAAGVATGGAGTAARTAAGSATGAAAAAPGGAPSAAAAAGGAADAAATGPGGAVPAGAASRLVAGSVDAAPDVAPAGPGRVPGAGGGQPGAAPVLPGAGGSSAAGAEPQASAVAPAAGSTAAGAEPQASAVAPDAPSGAVASASAQLGLLAAAPVPAPAAVVPNAAVPAAADPLVLGTVGDPPPTDGAFYKPPTTGPLTAPPVRPVTDPPTSAETSGARDDTATDPALDDTATTPTARHTATNGGPTARHTATADRSARATADNLTARQAAAAAKPTATVGGAKRDTATADKPAARHTAAAETSARDAADEPSARTAGKPTATGKPAERDTTADKPAARHAGTAGKPAAGRPLGEGHRTDAAADD